MGHFTWPKFLNLEAGNTGELPSETGVGDPLVREWIRSLNWNQHQIFHCTMPGPDAVSDGLIPEMNPPYDYDYSYEEGDPCYEVILHAPPKADTSNPTRQLYGAVVPWQVVPYYNRRYGMTTVPAEVTWEADQGAATVENLLWRSEARTADWAAIRANTDKIGEAIQLYNAENFIHMDPGCNLNHVHCYKPITSTSSLEKVTSTPNPYSGWCCLKATCGSSGDGVVLCKQPGTTSGIYTYPNKSYTVKGRYITDGSVSVTLYCGGTIATLGATSSWTEFNYTFTAGSWYIQFYSSASGYFALDNITVKEKGSFTYEPDSSGEWTVGKLRTKRIRPAAIGIWQCPDHELTSAQRIISPSDCGAGESIRGRGGSDEKSIGTLVHRMGRFGGLDDDDVERVTRRCLLGWGHPLGVGWENTEGSYVNIRAGEDSTFKVRPRNMLNHSGSNASFAYPLATVYTEGASVGVPAYIRFTAANNGSPSTVTIPITSDTGGLVGGTAIGGLMLSSGADEITVEIQAPGSGTIRVKSISIWEGPQQ